MIVGLLCGFWDLWFRVVIVVFVGCGDLGLVLILCFSLFIVVRLPVFRVFGFDARFIFGW